MLSCMKPFRRELLLVAAFCALEMPAAGEPLTLHTRSRVPSPADTNQWSVAEKTFTWDPQKTAIVICDMWNEHWCKGATERVAEMAPRMNQVISTARERGVFIIHCPSDTMKYYEGTPQRKLAQSAPPVTPKVPLQRWCNLIPEREAPLPIDASDEGCDDRPQCKVRTAWTHEIDTLEIKPGDAITDSVEAYYLMQQRGIENVIVMGVHGNMCVLGRPFAIRQMVMEGKHVLLMRDMTDTMYNSRMPPYVSHFAGTDLLVAHIEKYWCPTITSVDLIGGEPFRFKADKRAHIAFVIGENEYHTWETLPQFAERELAWRGFDCSFVMSSPNPRDNQFTNWMAIKNADLLVVSVRRRAPPTEMLDLIRAHLKAGKPLVGLRTASHAFCPESAEAGHDRWCEFDTEVLGCKYENHYGNGGSAAPSYIQVNPSAAGNSALTGIPLGEFASTSSLYKSHRLGPATTVLLTGKLADGSAREPVAWMNKAANRRVFYTSLGSPDDFKLPVFRRLLLNGMLWALNQPLPPAASTARQDRGMSPRESAESFATPHDLVFEQVLSEPEVRKPVFINFDERGRLWVVEYLQYPAPAGLKPLSHDSYWRAVYDKVPPPPPHHFVGADKISIYEDTKGDGHFDKHTTFVEGLNIATAAVRGRGGVFVLNPPYLLFYPDRNNDDIPDGDPEVLLSGFGLEDTHSVVNSLRWGPDGWLYACQGSTVTARVMRPGIDKDPIAQTMGQQIWRYHPETKRFEVFSEGGGNAFGCELDAKGRIFSGHNGGNTRGFHYMQGAYLQKGFEKHGPLSNPFAFGYFPPMEHPDVERFTHNFIIYDGGTLPAEYQGKLFGVEPLQGRVVESEITPQGSTFKTRDVAYPVTSQDAWFRPVEIKVGPDGAIYVADWYDRQVTHTHSQEGEIDKSHGRIYRLKARDAKPLKRFDLAKLSSPGLVNLLGNSNKWFRQEALRLLGDRKDKSLIPRLEMQLEQAQGQLALETFWALNLSGGFTEAVARKTLHHHDPFVRLWTARLLGDDGTNVSSALAAELAEVAAREPNVEVRAQLACTAKRLPATQALPLITRLLGQAEDLHESRLPLLLWWALEAKCDSDRESVLSLFRDQAFWQLPLVENNIIERIMRRFATSGERRDLLVCAQLLKSSQGPKETKQLMAGFEVAFKGRSLSAIPPELAEAMAASGGESVALGIRRGDGKAIDQGLKIAADRAANADLRTTYLQTLAEVKSSKVLPLLLALVSDSRERPIHPVALTALQYFDSVQIADAVLDHFKEFDEAARPAAINLLSCRPAWAVRLLEAVSASRIPRDSIPPETVSQIKALKPAPELTGLLAKLWPTEHVPTTAEMQTQIQRYAEVIRHGSGDPYDGRKLFRATCGTCHRLFAEGGQVGPDLTPYKRDDLDTTLRNIVNPSAEIREGYENYHLTTKDDRTLCGFLVDKDPQVVVIRGIDGGNIVVPQAEIAELKPAAISLMPEGLLSSMNDQQVRNLFAYLRSTQPLVGQPPVQVTKSSR
jgi:putative heme-binding domain-containing protein